MSLLSWALLFLGPASCVGPVAAEEATEPQQVRVVLKDGSAEIGRDIRYADGTLNLKQVGSHQSVSIAFDRVLRVEIIHSEKAVDTGPDTAGAASSGPEKRAPRSEPSPDVRKVAKPFRLPFFIVQRTANRKTSDIEARALHPRENSVRRMAFGAALLVNRLIQSGSLEKNLKQYQERLEKTKLTGRFDIALRLFICAGLERLGRTAEMEKATRELLQKYPEREDLRWVIDNLKKGQFPPRPEHGDFRPQADRRFNEVPFE